MKVLLYLLMAFFYAVSVFLLIGASLDSAGKLYFIGSGVFGCHGTLCGIGASVHDKLDRLLRMQARGAAQ